MHYVVNRCVLVSEGSVVTNYKAKYKTEGQPDTEEIIKISNNAIDKKVQGGGFMNNVKVEEVKPPKVSFATLKQPSTGSIVQFHRP